MANVSTIFILLVTPYLIAHLFQLNETIGGRVGICAVFLFYRHWPLIYLSGVVEVLFAITVLALRDPFYAGLCVIVYLFPSNIYAAVQRVPFGGDSMGPRYLFVRLPLQALLISWAYWFTVRAY